MKTIKEQIERSDRRLAEGRKVLERMNAIMIKFCPKCQARMVGDYNHWGDPIWFCLLCGQSILKRR